jgi:hypothetical protein
LTMYMDEVCSSVSSEVSASSPFYRVPQLEARGGLTDLLLALEDVHPPTFDGFPRLGRFVVLEHHAAEGAVGGRRRGSQLCWSIPLPTAAGRARR